MYHKYLYKTMKLRILAIIAMSLILVSCGTSRGSSSDSPLMPDGGGRSASVSTQKDRSFNQDYYSVNNKKMIFTAEISIKSANVDSTIRLIMDLAKSNGGYVQSSRNASVTIRVKSGDMESVINTIEKNWETYYKNITGQDVTEDYENTKIKLDNLMKARDQYLKLLEQSKNVTEALAVEKELERVNGDIDLITGRMKRMEHLISYATITVYVLETNDIKEPTPGPLGWIFVGLYKGIKWLFVWD